MQRDSEEMLSIRLFRLAQSCHELGRLSICRHRLQCEERLLSMTTTTTTRKKEQQQQQPTFRTNEFPMPSEINLLVVWCEEIIRKLDEDDDDDEARARTLLELCASIFHLQENESTEETRQLLSSTSGKTDDTARMLWLVSTTACLCEQCDKTTTTTTTTTTEEKEEEQEQCTPTTARKRKSRTSSSVSGGVSKKPVIVVKTNTNTVIKMRPCAMCHKPGHYAKNCPDRPEEERTQYALEMLMKRAEKKGIKMNPQRALRHVMLNRTYHRKALERKIKLLDENGISIDSLTNK